MNVPPLKKSLFSRKNAPTLFSWCRSSISARVLVSASVAFTLALPLGAAESGPGSVDPMFNPGNGANDEVSFILPLTAERTLIGGWFTSFDGSSHNHVAMLQSSGAPEGTFTSNIGTGANGPVLAAARQSDERLILVGAFDSFDGSGNKGGIVRLTSAGSVDPSFNPAGGADWVISDVALQPDGKIIVVGGFTTFAGVSRNGIARLNADGSLDTSFNPGEGANDWVYSVALLDDASILIGGDFTQFNNTNRNRMALLGASGNLLTGFTPVINGSVRTIRLQGNGIFIGGLFTDVSGISRNRIARLLLTGVVDASFDPGAGADADVLAIIALPDSRIVIGGGFTTFRGSPAGRIARLHPNGSLDTSFDVGDGPNGLVTSLALSGEENILVAGTFTEVNGENRRGIARLLGGGGGGSGYLFWISQFFSPAEQQNANIGTEEADPDGDGIPNLLEYAFNLDPRVSNPGRIPSQSLQTVDGIEFLAIEFRRSTNLPDATLSVEVSTDMENWATDTVQVGNPVLHDDNTETVVYRDMEPMSSFTSRFLRVTVTRE